MKNNLHAPVLNQRQQQQQQKVVFTPVFLFFFFSITALLLIWIMGGLFGFKTHGFVLKNPQIYIFIKWYLKYCVDGQTN